MTLLLTPNPAPPASFILTKIGGVTGRFVGALQGAGGHGSEFTHAALVLDHAQVIEAEPGGARIVPLQPYLDAHAADPNAVVFCDGPVRRRLVDYGGGDPDGLLEAALRRMVVAAGRSLEGTSYSFLDYASLALLHTIGANRRSKWLTDYVANSGHMQCAQLCDHAYLLAGIHLYANETPERAPGDVMPADLAQYQEDWLEELVGSAA